MNRAEFEARLLRDPELRRGMEKVEAAAKRVRQAQEDLLLAGSFRDYGIAWLASEGVPLATIARLVDLTPQRLGVIVRETIDGVRPEIPSDPDEAKAVIEGLRAKLARSEQELEAS